MKEPDFVVIRGTEREDGTWWNLRTIVPEGRPAHLLSYFGVPIRPEMEFEVRDDGAVAQVYRPLPMPQTEGEE